jgi:hypothetical protein
MGENLCYLYIWQRTKNQNIPGAQKKLNSQKNQWTNEEMDKWTEQKCFKGRNPNGQKEEMLTTPGYKGNANQNYTKILPHSC